MPTGEYERYRQHLDTQLRADAELIYEAYRAKLRAYETVARARGEDFDPLSPAAFPFPLPPAPPAPPGPLRAAPPPAPPPVPEARRRANEVEEAFWGRTSSSPRFSTGPMS